MKYSTDTDTIEKVSKQKMRYYKQVMDKTDSWVLKSIPISLLTALIFNTNVKNSFWALIEVIVIFLPILLIILSGYYNSRIFKYAICPYCHKSPKNVNGVGYKHKLKNGDLEYFCSRDHYWNYYLPKPKRREVNNGNKNTK